MRPERNGAIHTSHADLFADIQHRLNAAKGYLNIMPASQAHPAGSNARPVCTAEADNAMQE